MHVFEQLYPGQTRGVPRMTPALGKIKDRLDYDDTVMISEQIAACFTGFVTTVGDSNDIAAGSANATRSTGERLQDISPGQIVYLNEDQSIEFGNPNRPSGTFSPFMEHHQRSIAAALGYPFELLTKNFTGLSYATGRLSLIDGRMVFDAEQMGHVDGWLESLWSHVVTQSVLYGALGVLVDPIQFRSQPWLYTVHVWIPTVRPWVDPAKEVSSTGLAVESILSTLDGELAARGLDLEEVLDQKQYEHKSLVRRGLPTNMPMMNRDPAPPGDGAKQKGAPTTPAKKMPSKKAAA